MSWRDGTLAISGRQGRIVRGGEIGTKIGRKMRVERLAPEADEAIRADQNRPPLGKYEFQCSQPQWRTETVGT